MSFKILTDSTSDIDQTWAQEQGIDIVGLTVELDGKVYETVGPDRLLASDLLDKMRKGAAPRTSQVNAGTFEVYFRQQAEQGMPVLYIGFSSVLSGTYQSAVMARELVLEDYPDATIELIDTLAVSGGEGYLVTVAQEAKAAGASLEEVKALVEDKAPRLRSYFLIDDLHHLVRGGRLSKTSAVVGSLVNIKPILWVDPKGIITPLFKVRGRKKGITEIIAHATKDIADRTAVISYTNDLAGAENLKEQLLATGSLDRVLILPMGPVISAHVGPDSLGLYIVGNTAR